MNRDPLVPLVASPFRHYINGGWETGATTGISLNPSDLDEPLGEYVRADARQTDTAIEAASAAFREWSLGSAQRRADALDAIGSEMLARRDELGRLLAREVGKTLSEALAEATRAGQIFKLFAAEALRAFAEPVAAPRAGVEIDVTREPLGVIGIIAPWSAPLAIAAAKVGAALAHGNCVVFKPAESAPACAAALASIINRAGLPAGVFNLVMGSGRQVGARIAAHPLVAAVSFTGSAETGTRVLQAAAARQARVQLEMGGKNPFVVLADAELDGAVDAALTGAFSFAGQRGTAASRLIVERAVFEPFVDALRTKLARLSVDHALKHGTDIGPLANAAQLARNLDYVRIGQEEGAQLLRGGVQLERATRGYFFEPALFVAEPEHRIAREEIFGPLAVVLRADDYDHALHLANDTAYGLCAGICTRSLSRARHFRRHAHSGVVTINLPTTAIEHHAPGGGRKASAYGATDAAFWTAVKTAYVAG
ncbi:aldehyde dehydrogenase family protein [Paraburkholderia sp. DD10]|jgi:aldehyde dehydrogenase (NAD+)|uniref:Aldehyde dehydrogenase (NAD+) n=1 Tax=Paraburkholderia terricola TaxID=169427 RepID=A0A1M6LMS5_9BURK|nr:MULTISPECIES: aldehyde dehydrogenase family protein [Paraburkholderia]SDN88745.1 aldehyde dehydrogenase (NAD+) [Paraburkholderia sediminicola]SHJ72484.1 aldehyde dehydrogenase (NAD+) [Paraburkholderia terricola]